jgi:hypothetical protein
MKMTLLHKKAAWVVALASIAVSFALAGCKSDNSVTSSDTSVAASQDVAESAAGAVGSNTGGATDQLSDVSNLAYEAGVGTVASPEGNPPSVSSDTTIVSSEKTRVFNAADTSWTVVIQRTKTNGIYTGSWKRGYKYSYSRNGVKQKFFRTAGLGADKMTFDILSDSCSGAYRTTHLSHKLISLAGGWSGTINFGTGADSTLMTVNSTTTYARNGIDTITTKNAVRTSNNTLALTFVNVVVKRGVGRLALGYTYGRPISGTINGTFSGTNTFMSGKLYNETTFSRTFTITFGGTDNAAIAITGTGVYSGTLNLVTGELN